MSSIASSTASVLLALALSEKIIIRILEDPVLVSLTEEDGDVLHGGHHGLQRLELHLLNDVVLVPRVPVLDQPLKDVILRP